MKVLQCGDGRGIFRMYPRDYGDLAMCVAPVRASSRLPVQFTLVEMLVVIAIIGILASLLMPALHGALGSSRQAACSNNLRQMGIWGFQYSDEWNGILPHNGNYWVGDFRGYNTISNGYWISKNPSWQSTAKGGTVLHCPQASASVQPYTTDTWDNPAYSNTYGINRFVGERNHDSVNIVPPRTRLLSSKKFWFADGGGTFQANGKFRHFYMIDLNSWSGYNGKYVCFPIYNSTIPFHPQQATNFLYGDGRVAGLPYLEYFVMTGAQKTTLHGGWW